MAYDFWATGYWADNYWNDNFWANTTAPPTPAGEALTAAIGALFNQIYKIQEEE